MSLELHLDLTRGSLRLGVDESLSTERITGIFGPSGAGKTSLLRCIAGFERPRSARIRLGDECWQDSATGLFVAPHRRRVAYVFQEPRLFSHLTVSGNLDYARRRSRDPSRSMEAAVELFGLDGLLEQPAGTLSGGEAKRVAVARALLSSPSLLLMDEPAANLDEQHRRELLVFLARMQQELKLPVVYVSHDIDELCWLVDELLLLEGGRVVEHGPIHSLLAHTDLPMIGRRAAGVLVEAEMSGYDAAGQVSRLRFDGGELRVAGQVNPGRQRLRIRADDVSLALERPGPSSILNVLEGIVREVSDEGCGSVLVAVDVGATQLLARVSHHSAAELALAPGRSVFAQVKGIAVRNIGA